jgi:hypothetical protein
LPPTTQRAFSQIERCRQLQADPSNAAEVLLRERLVIATEGYSCKFDDHLIFSSAKLRQKSINFRYLLVVKFSKPYYPGQCLKPIYEK